MIKEPLPEKLLMEMANIFTKLSKEIIKILVLLGDS